MSYFVLTHGLRERLVASAPARVINTSSDAHKGKQIDFNDLQSANPYKGFQVYGAPSSATSCTPVNLRDAWPAPVSRQTACIRALSLHVLATRVVDCFR